MHIMQIAHVQSDQNYQSLEKLLNMIIFHIYWACRKDLEQHPLGEVLLGLDLQ